MTLTGASKLARKWVLFIILAIVIYYIILLILFPGAKAIIKAIIPEKDPPNTAFGALPALEFTIKHTKGDFDPKYILDTQDGRIPTGYPKKVKVYPVRTAPPSFEKGKNAINTAAELGFSNDDLVTSLKEPVYKWKKIVSDGILEIDTNTESLLLYTPLSGKSGLFPRGSLTEERAKEYAKTMFSKIDRFEDQLYIEGKQKVNLGQFSGTVLKKASSIGDAQVARVDFFRSIEEYPILGPDPQVGLIYTFLRKPQRDDIFYNFPIMRSYLTQIDQKTEATYPLINVATAWDFVSENKGAVVSILPESISPLVPYTPVRVEEVFINSIYLAYYDSDSEQDYLQPVYVFEGKYTTSGTQGGSIHFYYPAISPEFIKAAE
ncbi:hypothetical protein ACFLZK_02830 [Patescibacteria group bacterium]